MRKISVHSKQNISWMWNKFCCRIIADQETIVLIGLLSVWLSNSIDLEIQAPNPLVILFMTFSCDIKEPFKHPFQPLLIT